MLQNARQSIDRLDEVSERGAEGGRIHIGASVSLEVSVNEVIRLVKILDGYNRFRFVGETRTCSLAGSQPAYRGTAEDRRSRGRADGRTVRSAGTAS